MPIVNHRCAVLGKPIAHSLSPVLHNAAYRALGFDDWAYSRHEVDETELDEFLQSLDNTWAGLSLTMPLKKTIQPYGTLSDTWTERLHVANTVVFDWNTTNSDIVSEDAHSETSTVNSKQHSNLPAMRLYNTDVTGIVLAFAHARSTSAHTSSALTSSGTAVVLGNGNTAMSAIAACTMMNTPTISHITVAARHPGRNTAELHHIVRNTGCTLNVIPLSAALEALCHADIAISTLPAHAADPLATAIHHNTALSPRGMLLDVVYDPRPTDLMSVWSLNGAPTIGGQNMLLYQAIAQVGLMTGRGNTVADIIEKPMRQALEEVL